jgi:hypothetical protein
MEAANMANKKLTRWDLQKMKDVRRKSRLDYGI